jgi:hypothetical protein
MSNRHNQDPALHKAKRTPSQRARELGTLMLISAAAGIAASPAAASERPQNLGATPEHTAPKELDKPKEQVREMVNQIAERSVSVYRHTIKRPGKSYASATLSDMNEAGSKVFLGVGTFGEYDPEVGIPEFRVGTEMKRRNGKLVTDSAKSMHISLNHQQIPTVTGGADHGESSTSFTQDYGFNATRTTNGHWTLHVNREVDGGLVAEELNTKYGFNQRDFDRIHDDVMGHVEAYMPEPANTGGTLYPEPPSMK